MIRFFDPLMRMMSVCALLITGALLFSPQTAHAQSEDIDWADAGVPSLGTFPSGTTVTGSDGTTATVTRTISTSGGGSFTPASFADDFLSYFNGQIGNSQSPLLLNFNNSSFDPLDRVTVDITLSRAVGSLNFALSDIDNGSFVDAVEVFYDDNLTGSFTNAATNTSFWTTGSAVARTNDATVNGWIGINGSDQFTTNGDIAFDFGGTQVRRIRIVYFSYTGTDDPTNQFASISDFTYAGPGADLSLSKSLLGSPPGNGQTATWRLTVTNDSTSQLSASGIVVRDTLPASFAFDNASGVGSFNSATGDWTVGALAPGESASINIAGSISATAGSTVTNVAEIVASSAFDPDSTVNNGVNSEDDFASSSFTVAADPPNFPPTLPCPIGTSVFNWDTVSWPGGSLNNSYQLGAFGTISFDIVTDGNFVSRGSFGGAVPRLTTAVSGGLNPRELALAFNQNNSTRAQQAVTTITLPRIFTGAQFAVFDIDRSNTFEDRVTAYGLLNGVRVNAVLTSGPSNTVSGSSIIGSAGAGDATANGTGVITFLDPIDTIVIEYGNGPGAPDNPSNQSIAIHDINLCTPQVPNISVTKVSSIVGDPVNGTTNPKAIPGATVEYLITVSNTGTGAADLDSLMVLDNGPADAKMCQITRPGGPVIFADPGGTSGLSYTFGGLSAATDDVEFSNDNGSSFAYTPVADGDDCDAAVTDFRLRPDGAFAGGSSITLRVRYQVE